MPTRITLPPYAGNDSGSIGPSSVNVRSMRCGLTIILSRELVSNNCNLTLPLTTRLESMLGGLAIDGIRTAAFYELDNSEGILFPEPVEVPDRHSLVTTKNDEVHI